MTMKDKTTLQMLAEAKLAFDALEAVWGDEWHALTAESQASVAHDFIEANMTASEYKARIWEGNLASYVKCIENVNIPCRYFQ